MSVIKAKSPAPTRKRVTLRSIARAAKVSVMTVSYALRDVPEVSEPERRRIQKIAESLGYRPDPLLTHLMEHLRSQRTLKSTANLAVLTTLDAGFVRRLLVGAKVRGERLGYTLDVLDPRSFGGKPGSLTRTLLARGVSGLLLAPTAEPTNYRDLLDWSQFASVAMTYSVVEPHVYRVVTHHFDNAVRTFAWLQQRGFKRIGLVMTRDMEFRANHSYSGAYFRMLGMSGLDALPILYLDESDARRISGWVAKQKPDAVVVANARQARDIILPAVSPRAAKGITFLTLDYEPDGRVSGIDQLFETIGAHAIDALVAQIHRNERGLPEKPTITMVEGRWVEV